MFLFIYVVISVMIPILLLSCIELILILSKLINNCNNITDNNITDNNITDNNITDNNI